MIGNICNVIPARWPTIKHIINIASFNLNAVSWFAHSDLDMLEIGNGNLTLPEQRTHFALWAAMKSPLLIGTDLGDLAPAELETLKNRPLIAFNQDPRHPDPAKPFNWDWTFNDDYPAAFWSGRGDEGVLVCVVNYHEREREMGVSFRDVPELRAGREKRGYKVLDAWTGRELGCLKGWSGVVEKHDTAVLVVGGQCDGAEEFAFEYDDGPDVDEYPEPLRKHGDERDGGNEDDARWEGNDGHGQSCDAGREGNGKYTTEDGIGSIDSGSANMYHDDRESGVCDCSGDEYIENNSISIDPISNDLNDGFGEVCSADGQGQSEYVADDNTGCIQPPGPELDTKYLGDEEIRNTEDNNNNDNNNEIQDQQLPPFQTVPPLQPQYLPPQSGPDTTPRESTHYRPGYDQEHRPNHRGYHYTNPKPGHDAMTEWLRTNNDAWFRDHAYGRKGWYNGLRGDGGFGPMKDVSDGVGDAGVMQEGEVNERDSGVSVVTENGVVLDEICGGDSG